MKNKNFIFILIGIIDAAEQENSRKSWRDYVGEEYSQAKNMFDGLIIIRLWQMLL